MTNRPVLCAQRNYQSRAEAINYVADFTPLLQADELIESITGTDTHGQALGVTCADLQIEDVELLAADTIIDAQDGRSGIEVLAEKALTFTVLAAAVPPEDAAGEGTEFEIEAIILSDANNTRRIVCALVIQD